MLVTLDGQPIYAAQQYIRIGAAALRHPVVHLDRLEQHDVEMCAVLGGGANAEEASRIDRPELRELFAARGVLRESSR